MQVIASVTHTRVSDLVHEEQDLVADLVLEVLSYDFSLLQVF